MEGKTEKTDIFKKIYSIPEYWDSIWVNYNDLTATSLGIMVNKRNHPQMALIQDSEILQFTQIVCAS